MSKFKKKFLLAVVLIISCQKSTEITKHFEYVIVFSERTAYFFGIKEDGFVKDNVLFIRNKNLNRIINKINNAKKILLTQKFNSVVLSKPELKNRIYYLSNVEFHFKKSINFIFKEYSMNPKKIIIMSDNSLNKEDSEYLKKRIEEEKIKSVIINEINLSSLKNFITSKIEHIVIFSLKNNDIYLKKIMESPLFKNVDFTLIGNVQDGINALKVKYLITIKSFELINIVKEIDNNFKYEFNIYKK